MRMPRLIQEAKVLWEITGLYLMGGLIKEIALTNHPKYVENLLQEAAGEAVSADLFIQAIGMGTLSNMTLLKLGEVDLILTEEVLGLNLPMGFLIVTIERSSS